MNHSSARLRDALIRVYGVVLLTAGIAKTFQGDAIPHGWGVPRDGVLQLLLFGGEIWLGSWLIMQPRGRVSTFAGLAMSSAFVVSHCVSWAVGSAEACNCFGAVPVPDGFSWVVAGLGFAVCLWQARSLGLGYLGRTASMSLGAMLLLVGQLLDERGASATGAAEVFNGFGVRGPAIVVAGSLSCSECLRAIGSIDSMSLGRQRVLVVPEHEVGRTAPAEAWWCVGVPMSEWWTLVGVEPPGIWCLEVDGVQRVDGVEALERCCER